MKTSPRSAASHDTATASQARLVDAGFEIALDGGLGALSARALADRLHASPSAMNYHFGNRDGLLEALQKRAVAQSQTWRVEHAGTAGDGAPWTTLADIFLALIQARLSQTRRLQLLLLEFAAEAEIYPGLAADARAEAEADHRFWTDMAGRIDDGAGSAAIWSDMAAGLILNFASEESPTVRGAWMGGALRRLADRLDGRTASPIKPATDLNPVRRLESRAPRGETAIRIVRAALQVIGDKGAARMSQREVAAAAGVSLAAVTYFYRTRSDLIAAAFSALHSGLRSEVLDRSSAPERGSWSAAVFDGDGKFDWRVSALRELMVLAGRDRSLISIVQDSRAGHGATSISLLQRHGVADADQLDAFVLSTVLRGASERVRFMPPQMRATTFEARAKQTFALVFKPATPKTPAGLGPAAPAKPPSPPAPP
jgi:AcrR family transcriptional regulator